MSNDFNNRLSERLKSTDHSQPTRPDYVKPTRLERRLERKGNEALELHGTLDPTGKNPIIKTFIIIVYLLGIIGAMIPFLIYNFFVFGFLYLIYKFFSYF